jgi:hypothetical protein
MKKIISYLIAFIIVAACDPGYKARKTIAVSLEKI